ncbi:nitrate reductase subunit alpha [Thalassobacillus pellis]|uniref:nitrate reductase subunit alpha n=1 Tax=Thalassobacillus pellis TaxID=748008 RepID=UPI00195F95EA|nr:nitrate reductase subunit alpha [Thalassobacillus pellis]MBM7551958.1 nitrate reductase alpha subunit [Thalassobacillus pellis]
MPRKTPPFLQKLKYLGKTQPETDHSEMSPKSRTNTENYYRSRWQHDKVVRSTHGVNCTGSCSWKIHVKDGIITWETQQTDYPTTGPDMPEYEPRGCPRGASFSWYTYSPHRVRYPYIRSSLLKIWREAVERHKDPVNAWASIADNKELSTQYKQARGKGGFVRAEWEEIETLICAQLIYTIQQYGPDRIFGFSPIPAMSMVSYAGGGRFLNLIGGVLLSFYDWYADLPPASPQIWGEQTDVPESADWYNSSYLLVWGSNLPQTRTPDSHFMVEARYKGTKVVAVSPDYAEFVKFADDWLPVQAGMDSALAMAMTHVILQEFYIDRHVPYFDNYAKTYTDLPYLLTLKQTKHGLKADRFLRASDLSLATDKAEWKTIIYDEKTGDFGVPNGSIGHRWDGNKDWNLLKADKVNKVETLSPALSIEGHEDTIEEICVAAFEQDDNRVFKSPIPVKKVETKDGPTLVTTVFDLMCAQSGVKRNLAGETFGGYEEDRPYTPKWQEKYTNVSSKLVAQIAREFAQNAIDSKGRSMIIMGSGINHWYHSDTIYRAVLNLVLLTGSQGVNGGGWAHYVGQEKVRPLEGWQTIAMARDWGGPPRLQNGTSFFYFATEQWKYEEQKTRDLASPLIEKPKYQNLADYNVLAARLGWLPSYPQFNRNSTTMYDESKSPEANIDDLVNSINEKKMNFAIESPNDPVNFPKTMFVWRANLIGSSAKGHEYFLKHLLGTHGHNLSEENDDLETTEINLDIPSATGKLDLLINLDFRMSGTGLYSDIVLPAATWYEKYDLSSTDMHPFVHPFNPAITPPWESRSDWDIFKKLAKRFSTMAKTYLPETVKDTVSTPLLHDSTDEIAQPYGQVNDWKTDGTKPVPGMNFPKVTVVEREYHKVFDKFISLGPKIKDSIGAKGMAWDAKEEYEKLFDMLGPSKKSEYYQSCPSLYNDIDAAEAILTLSSTTNGSLAMKAWKTLEAKSGQKLKDLAEERAEEHISFAEITAQPQKVISSPVFSGTETGNRRYSPFTTNVERMIPWRTLTGRQHFYLDHETMLEFGEELPTFKPPLKKASFYTNDNQPAGNEKEITLRYLTPHYKWSFHSTYADTLPMLTLFRGGPHVWLNNLDADEVGIKDNDWLEMYNRNGVVVARAVTSHRMPRGVVFMYHVQDRLINVPGSKITKDRGGTFNSPTRIHIKPTQMIGGYAQLSYGFNYYGPTGNQRDEQVQIRRMDRSEVDWLED